MISHAVANHDDPNVVGTVPRERTDQDLRALGVANIALTITYALTIITGAIGEWNYYLLGSAIEIAQLAAIAYYAWTWPTRTPPTSGTPDAALIGTGAGRAG